MRATRSGEMEELLLSLVFLPQCCLSPALRGKLVYPLLNELNQMRHEKLFIMSCILTANHSLNEMSSRQIQKMLNI